MVLIALLPIFRNKLPFICFIFFLSNSWKSFSSALFTLSKLSFTSSMFLIKSYSWICILSGLKPRNSLKVSCKLLYPSTFRSLCLIRASFIICLILLIFSAFTSSGDEFETPRLRLPAGEDFLDLFLRGDISPLESFTIYTTTSCSIESLIMLF